jgi:7-cyano-7-deazaguanine synthase in queuosine biosynthesis
VTRSHLRTNPSGPQAGADDFQLDWFPGDHRSTVQAGTELLAGLTPPTHARDLLRLAVASYCADRLSARAGMTDGWTRELKLSIPVAVPARWDAASAPLTEALSFLSGDHWSFDFRADGSHSVHQETALDIRLADAVCLFSGGLDSLCGAIDLLEDDKRLILVGHYESGIAPSRQSALFQQLRQHYGEDRVAMRHLFLRPAPSNRHQARPLPRQRENTMRSRSILFIAAGFAVASSIGSDVPLYIPENGFIGINVPLTRSRPGSLSTRTTHPYFFERLTAATQAIGLTNELVNPYRVQTKGEMLAGSRNQTLLRTLAPISVSCSHPETARYARRPQGNCGYCYPCLIRRASLHAIGADNETYAYDLAAESALFLGRSAKGASVRALIRSLASTASPHDVLRNGPIPQGQTEAFAEMYMRGRDELRRWLIAAGGPAIASRLGT